MTLWHPNLGERPHHVPDAPIGTPALQKVYVRLRNGRAPTEPWPVDTGRRETTRWTLIGDPFDIVEWRPA